MSTMQAERTSSISVRKLRPLALACAYSAFDRLIGLLVLWRKRAAARRQLRALCELDDHLLKDIGLTRPELRARVFRPFGIAKGATTSIPYGTPPRSAERERRQ